MGRIMPSASAEEPNSLERVRASRATLEDIARDAGMSVATVDRVINDRPGVRERTRKRVLEVAARLRYVDLPKQETARNSAIDIVLDFILPNGSNPFISLLAQHLEAHGSGRPDLQLRVHTIEGFSPIALATKLAELVGHTQGVGVIALDHPIVREAIRTLEGSGVPIITLASDITQTSRLAYIGIDNRAAGRLAGYLIGRFLPRGPGKIALFKGSMSYRGHEEREMGFRSALSETAPELTIIESRELADDPALGYREACSLLERCPELSGIYSIGGGSDGIGQALEEARRGQEVVFVAHDLSESTRRLLSAGVLDMIIDQNPRVEAREAIEILAQAARREPFKPPANVLVRAIFRENLP